jgi:hypothetical protein
MRKRTQVFLIQSVSVNGRGTRHLEIALPEDLQTPNFLGHMFLRQNVLKFYRSVNVEENLVNIK